MSGGWIGVLAVRAALLAVAVFALPWLLGEVHYVSLEPGEPAEPQRLPRVAHTRPRTESVPGTYVRAVRKHLSLSSALFCLAFEESAMLFMLVLMEHVYGDVPWVRAHWNISLPMVLALIVLGLPLCACLLICFGRGRQARWLTTRGLATSALFVAWCWAFLRVPLPHTVIVGSKGFLGPVIARTGVIGISLIAILSGSAASGAICDSYEMLTVQRQRRWREYDVSEAQAAFERACTDLQQTRMQASEVSDELAKSAPRPLWQFWSRSAKDRELASLQTELIGLEAMASTMRTDLEAVRAHDRRTRYQRTPLGRVLLLGTHVFSVYCAFRVVQSLLNFVVLGYKKASPDFVSTCLVHAVRLLGIDIDVALWAPRIGFLFVGGLIVLRMRALLSTLSALIRVVSSGISTQLLVLFTADVVSIYTLAALIQMHAHTADHKAQSTLLSTLPEFQRVFGALFDGVFLLAAILTGGYRWFGWQSDLAAAP